MGTIKRKCGLPVARGALDGWLQANKIGHLGPTGAALLAIVESHFSKIGQARSKVWREPSAQYSSHPAELSAATAQSADGPTGRAIAP